MRRDNSFRLTSLSARFSSFAKGPVWDARSVVSLIDRRQGVVIEDAPVVIRVRFFSVDFANEARDADSHRVSVLLWAPAFKAYLPTLENGSLQSYGRKSITSTWRHRYVCPKSTDS